MHAKQRWEFAKATVTQSQPAQMFTEKYPSVMLFLKDFDITCAKQTQEKVRNALNVYVGMRYCLSVEGMTDRCSKMTTVEVCHFCI